VSTMWQK